MNPYHKRQAILVVFRLALVICAPIRGVDIQEQAVLVAENLVWVREDLRTNAPKSTRIEESMPFA
jgi:hypothetical protein